MTDHNDPNSNVTYEQYEQNYTALAGWYHQTRLRARREDIFTGMFGTEFLILEGVLAAVVSVIQVIQLDHCRRLGY
jgi:hypothetical protein